LFLVPQSAPNGIKLLLHQCWNFKPRNRPSFSQILKHLEIVSSNEILLKIDDEYLKSQISWKEEVAEKMSLKQFDVSTIQLFNNLEDDLIQKRKEELKHATDIRELYEQKLEKANNLYFELSTVLVQLDQRERELIKREKEFNIQNEKIVRPILKREFSDRTKSYNQTKSLNDRPQEEPNTTTTTNNLTVNKTEDKQEINENVLEKNEMINENTVSVIMNVDSEETSDKIDDSSTKPKLDILVKLDEKSKFFLNLLIKI